MTHVAVGDVLNGDVVNGDVLNGDVVQVSWHVEDYCGGCYGVFSL